MFDFGQEGVSSEFKHGCTVHDRHVECWRWFRENVGLNAAEADVGWQELARELFQVVEHLVGVVHLQDFLRA